MNGRHEFDAEPAFWIGRLSKGVSLAIVDLRDKRPDVAREHLHELIRDFMASPVPSSELRANLRGDLRRRRR